MPTGQDFWRRLRLLAVYRLLVAMVVLASIGAGLEGVLLEAARPQLFLQAGLGYFLAALGMLVVSLELERQQTAQAVIHVLADVLLLSVLVYAAGLENTALGILLVVAVAGGSTLLPTRLALFVAAVGSLALLFQHWLQGLQPEVTTISYTQVGLLGAALFIISLSGNLLARRAAESQALAEKRGVDLANLEALNGYIVQRLVDGVIVLNEYNQVRLTNHSALKQLGIPRLETRSPQLSELSPTLARQVRRWRQKSDFQPEPVALVPGAGEVQPRLLPLGPDRGHGVLIFLEDLAELRSRVQQAKLASMGRLAGSIAHEIRNPLSAMSHAAQLLEESDLTPADQRLLNIILQQGRRLNEIVESVLGLSRRQQPESRTVPLRQWLEGFLRELDLQTELKHLKFELGAVPERLALQIDPGHLHQVMTNLVHNAAHHGKPDAGQPVLTFSAGQDRGGQVWLQLRDNGPGIPDDVADQLFEPFYTTSRQGTGLGLYLCRELCESNQARLVLTNAGEPGACFRIIGHGAEVAASKATQQGPTGNEQSTGTGGR